MSRIIQEEMYLTTHSCAYIARLEKGQEYQDEDPTAASDAALMKTLLIATALTLLAVFYVGYYQALEDGDIETIVFIKQHPTLQMKFYNLHANDGEIRKVERLTEQERRWIIDYCRYRLGIDTVLTRQEEVETCGKK
ncbi:hypothetical protein SAMN03159362_1659 [Pseudomonas sp. NFIX51]|nr:hypothetical protein SAMN03159414_1852 [Pseudomonas sp. NFACC41-3]SMH41405.1 hypothetical protein SAMN03159362_1659 [Pseudomonas sp. NFIX51]